MPKGFASLSPEQRRRIASMGGTAAHRNGSAHEFTQDEARAAGKIGGRQLVRKRGAGWMGTIGRKGGSSRIGGNRGAR